MVDIEPDITGQSGPVTALHGTQSQAPCTGLLLYPLNPGGEFRHTMQPCVVHINPAGIGQKIGPPPCKPCQQEYRDDKQPGYGPVPALEEKDAQGSGTHAEHDCHVHPVAARCAESRHPADHRQ